METNNWFIQNALEDLQNESPLHRTSRHVIALCINIRYIILIPKMYYIIRNTKSSKN